MGSNVTPGRLVRRAIPGFAGWTAALGVFLLLFGADAVVQATTTLLGPAVVPLLTLGVAATVCWGLGLRSTLAAAGEALHPLRAVGLFFASTFINGVTPFGQTGGDPVTAALVERTANVEYETGLAALVSVTGLNRIVSVVVAAAAGVLYLWTDPGRVTTGTLGGIDGVVALVLTE